MLRGINITSICYCGMGYSYLINCMYLIFFLHLCFVFKVRVDLTETEHVCSSASKKGRYRQEVHIGPETTRSVPFIIIPMKEGQFQIEVKAAVKDSSLNDGIMKLLRVVVSGFQPFAINLYCCPI